MIQDCVCHPLFQQVVEKRLRHLIETREAPFSKEKHPRTLLEIRDFHHPSTLLDHHLNSKDLYLLGGPSFKVKSKGFPVAFKSPHIPFSASCDVIVCNAFFPLEGDVNLQEFMRMLLGCLKPGGRFYFNTVGPYSFYECAQEEGFEKENASLPSFQRPYVSWFPEPSACHVFEEWYQVPVASIQQLEATLHIFQQGKKGLSLAKFQDSLSFQVIYGTYQKSYDLPEEE